VVVQGISSRTVTGPERDPQIKLGEATSAAVATLHSLPLRFALHPPILTTSLRCFYTSALCCNVQVKLPQNERSTTDAK